MTRESPADVGGPLAPRVLAPQEPPAIPQEPLRGVPPRHRIEPVAIPDLEDSSGPELPRLELIPPEVRPEQGEQVAPEEKAPKAKRNFGIRQKESAQKAEKNNRTTKVRKAKKNKPE